MVLVISYYNTLIAYASVGARKIDNEFFLLSPRGQLTLRIVLP